MHAHGSKAHHVLENLLTLIGGVLPCCGPASLVVHRLLSLCANMFSCSSVAAIAASNSWLIVEFIPILRWWGSTQFRKWWGCELLCSHAMQLIYRRAHTRDLYGRFHRMTQLRGSLGFACFHWEWVHAVELFAFFLSHLGPLYPL